MLVDGSSIVPLASAEMWGERLGPDLNALSALRSYETGTQGLKSKSLKSTLSYQRRSIGEGFVASFIPLGALGDCFGTTARRNFS